MLLCWLVQNGHTQIVELLLKKQVDPNVQRQKWLGMLLWWLVKMVILK